MYPQPQHYGIIVGSSAEYFGPTTNTTAPFTTATGSTICSSTASLLSNNVSLVGNNGTNLVPTSSTAPLASNLASKRSPLSVDDESTDEDLESSNKSLQMVDNNMDGSCHLMSRKKRRGMIEKRRRDRINNSLHELKRLVPAAFEKQGSAKLEKAEILQMTVDHLRMLHSKGFDAFSFDPHKFATDYHIIGFRECAAEVARYLVVHEGIDFQDPLRLRLISHLQCYSAQRELSLKSNTGWNPSLFTTPMYPPPASTVTSSTSPSVTSGSAGVANNNTNANNNNNGNSNNNNNNSVQLHTSSANNLCDTMNTNPSTAQHQQSQPPQQHNAYGTSYTHYSQQYEKLDTTPSNMGCNSGQQTPLVNVKSPMSPAFSLGGYGSSTAAAAAVAVAANTSSIHSSIHSPTSSSHSYSYSYPTGSYFAPSASYMSVVPTGSGQSPGQTAANAQTVNSVKHYRPWGTELAY